MSNSNSNFEDIPVYNDINYFDMYIDDINSILANPQIDNIIENMNEKGFDYKLSMNLDSERPLFIINMFSYYSHLFHHHREDFEKDLRNSGLENEKIEHFLKKFKNLNENSFKLLDCFYFTELNRLKKPRIQEISNLDLTIQETFNESNEIIGYTPYVNIGLKFKDEEIVKKQYLSIPYDYFKSLLKFLNTIDNEMFRESLTRYKSKINDLLYMED